MERLTPRSVLRRWSTITVAVAAGTLVAVSAVAPAGIAVAEPVEPTESAEPAESDTDPGEPAERTEPDAEPAEPAAEPDAAIPARFIDVSENHRFYAPIDWMRRTGLSTVIRTSEGIAYWPKARLSREAMAAFLFRASGETDYEPPASSYFVDVPTGHKFYREISWLRATGITTGIRGSQGLEFQPSTRLSRQAMAAFMYRAAGSPNYSAPTTSSFLDVGTRGQFYREISWLASSGLTTGSCSPRGREFYPYDRLSREALAAFMFRSETGRTSTLADCARPNLSNPAFRTVVVNKQRQISPARWVPGDLRRPNGIANPNGQPLRGEAATALERMHRAMRAEIGGSLQITSGFRSYDYQASLFQSYVRRDGLAYAERHSARPGHSEHQTGWAVDLGNGRACTFESCFGTTSEGRWLRGNAHRFGFILRYDQGQEPTTGFLYEPWHFRYVGTAVARDMRDRNFPNLETYFTLPAAPRY